MADQETIDRAAIWWSGMVYTVPRPGRHGDVIKKMSEHGLPMPKASHHQGFTTSTGRFVDRQEGLRIAGAAGQIIRKTQPEHTLFSEDLW